MKYIIDTGFLGLEAAAQFATVAKTDLLAVTVAPDCKNYTDITANVLEAFADVPVYEGATRPTLCDALPTATAPSAEAYNALADGHAVNALLTLSAQHKGLTVVCLGPLTNLALAIMKEPTIVQNIGTVIIAGGAQLGYGDVTEVAEYNIFSDPEAADTVVNSGLPLVFIPFESSDNYRKTAAGYALNTTVATETFEAFVDIDVVGSRTYGQTVIDPIGWNPINNTQHAGKKYVIVAKANEDALANTLKGGNE